MLDLTNTRAILTGASRGLGVVIADTLAQQGVDLVLAARNLHELEDVAAQVARHGRKVVVVPTDVGDRDALGRLHERARAELGEIDLLVNNAGIEHSSYYEDLTLDELQLMLQVNLGAPMLLTRMVLPDMLARDRGHVVNVASLGALAPNAYGESYGGTKAGLVGFTRSLRVSLKNRGSAVSASVICPGFVRETGMYANGQREHGVQAPSILGTCTPGAVAAAVVRAIEDDEAQIIVNGRPVRPFLALGALSPALLDWFAEKLKINQTLRVLADGRRAERRQRPPV